jgi:hypothetical protein
MIRKWLVTAMLSATLTAGMFGCDKPKEEPKKDEKKPAVTDVKEDDAKKAVEDVKDEASKKKEEVEEK